MSSLPFLSLFSHFRTLNGGSCLGTHSEIQSSRSSFPLSVLKGIIVHCSIYSTECVRVFVRIPLSQLWNSSVKERASSQGGTRLCCPADIHSNIKGQCHRRLSQHTEGRFPHAQKWGLEERGGTETVGAEDERKPKMRDVSVGIKDAVSSLRGADRQRSRACRRSAGARDEGEVFEQCFWLFEGLFRKTIWHFVEALLHLAFK